MRITSIIWKITKWTFATLGVLIIVTMGIAAYSFWKQDQWTPDRIERITGVKIPKYKVVNTNEGARGFNGDYYNEYMIEFKKMPSDELFDEIDRMIEEGNKDWNKKGNQYTYSRMWGNGLPAPKGESEDDDIFFDITISRGEKTGKIRLGAW